MIVKNPRNPVKALAILLALMAAPTLLPAQDISFDFAEGNEGWTFTTVVPTFSAPLYEVVPGALQLQAAPGALNTFGFVESQPITVPGAADDLILADFYVRTDIADPTTVPQFRLRFNETSFQRSSFITAESRLDGGFSPTAEGVVYTVPLTRSKSDSAVIANFDILNFEPDDSTDGALLLDKVDIRTGLSLPASQRIDKDYTFESGTQGWLPVTIDAFTAPTLTASGGALQARGFAGDSNTFGFWTSPGDVIIEANRAYFATFKVESDRVVRDRPKIPQFRVRLNESGFQSSSFVAVESSNTGAHSPIAGEIRDYTTYFIPPKSSVGRSLLASFDFLNFDPNDAGDATLKLHSVRIASAVNSFSVEQKSIAIDQSLPELTIEVGETAYLTLVSSVDDPNGNTTGGVLSLTNTVEGGTAGGLTATGDQPSAWFLEGGNQVFPSSLSVTGVTPGTYTIDSALSLDRSDTTISPDEVVNSSITVNVVSETTQTLVLSNLGTWPPALPAGGDPQDVLFSVTVSGVDTPPDGIDLVEITPDVPRANTAIGILRDNGLNGDGVAGDGVFSGTFRITPRATAGESTFQGNVQSPTGRPKDTNIFSLPTTSLPIGTAPLDTKQVIIAADGSRLVSDEVLATFKKGTTQAEINSVLESFGGFVVGTVGGLDAYQIRFNGDTEQDVAEALAALRASTVVASASASVISDPDGYPNDPSFSQQYGMSIIRAQEVWQIANGDVTIAVIDTGVDYTHPDLDGRVIMGPDFIDEDGDPYDDDGHGTHVATIAAGQGNDSIGIAGVAWGSQVLAIRGIGGNVAQLAQSIRYAANNEARLILVAGGVDQDVDILREAVDFAVGKGCLVVGSAGNFNPDTPDSANIRRYPGAYTNVLCVGNSKHDDSRSPTSRRGSWVDIAAPGDDILAGLPDSSYGFRSGTSMSAALVAGAASVVWSNDLSLTADEVRRRLQESGAPIGSGLQIGATRLDVFEAVFNGSFEISDLAGWFREGTTGSITALSTTAPSLQPTHRSRMGLASTGPESAGVEARLDHEFFVQPGISELNFMFDYNFLTEEFDEFVGQGFNDTLTITIYPPHDATPIDIVVENVDSSDLHFIEGIDFPGGDNTVGETGWRSVDVKVPVGQGEGFYGILISDGADDRFDSVLLIDNIHLGQPTLDIISGD